jgi:hypothetical protein
VALVPSPPRTAALKCSPRDFLPDLTPPGDVCGQTCLRKDGDRRSRETTREDTGWGQRFLAPALKGLNYSWGHFDLPDLSLTQAAARYNSKLCALRGGHKSHGKSTSPECKRSIQAPSQARSASMPLPHLQPW